MAVDVRRASVAREVQELVTAKLGQTESPAGVEPVSDQVDVIAAKSGGDEKASIVKKRVEPKVFAPQSAIIMAAMKAATTPQARQQLAGRRAVALVIQVPSAGWIKPVEQYLQERYEKLFVIARDGSNRTRDVASVGNDEVASALSRGRQVVGIAVNPGATLPSTLVATADHTIKLASPNGKVVREAMRRCYGRGVPTVIDDAVVAGLELEDLVAVMRKGSPPSEVFTRLHNASRIRNNITGEERLPPLETAVEYGQAQIWGLELAKDFTDYRAGKISWADASRGAVIHSKTPGLGKSLYAKILARKCGVPLILTSIPDLFAASAGFLDSVIKAQRAVFARAGALSPCLIFIDEIDALPNRATISPRGSDWWLPVIEDFLLLLDSAVSQREGVCVLGATNRLEGVDAAIMRPGRLEVAIEIQHPDLAGIVNILKFHLHQDLPGVDLSGFARMLEGTTGADIMLRVRNARRTARQAGRAMTADDLMGAIMPQEIIPAAALHRMTLHEAAHAVVAIATGFGRVAFCRVQSGAGEAGRTAISSDRSDYLTAQAIENRVIGMLAGRMAERILIGAVSDGGASDLKHATGTIAAMHISSGLGGQLVYLGDETEALRQVRRDKKLRSTVETHLQQLQRRSEMLVRQHRQSIAAVASELAARRFLSGEAIEAIMARFPQKRANTSRGGTKPARR